MMYIVIYINYMQICHTLFTLYDYSLVIIVCYTVWLLESL